MKRFTLLLSAMLLVCATSLQAVDFTLTSASDVTKSGVTVSFAKGDGSNSPTWYAAGLRLYAKNTITITSTTEIDSITFNWEKQGTKAFATVTANCGNYSHPTEAGKGVWTKSEATPTTSVTLTLGESGQLQLNTFSVYVVASAAPSIDAADVEFGKVIETGMTKELDIIGTNLTEVITYSMSDDADFTAEGTLTAEGGTLTITFKGTTADYYAATLTLVSGSVTKMVNISATMPSTTGKGTRENPFTVADVMALNNELGTSQKYWVIGYIVGACNGSLTSLETETTVASNIALAATDEEFGDDYIPVALVNQSDARSALNIANNTANVGKQVKVCGTLEQYFGTTGVKNVASADEYEILANPTAIPTTTFANPAIKTIENGQLVILRDGVKYNAMGVRLQ
ncbi:MAG: DUF6359 domain-containing protein [Paludibacteraceae bacterium]